MFPEAKPRQSCRSTFRGNRALLFSDVIDFYNVVRWGILAGNSFIRELKNHDEVHDDDVCWLGKDWNENLSFGGKKET